MSELTKVDDVLGVTLPEWLFEKSSIVAKKPDSLRYTCPKCGPQEPRKYRNGYTRRECPCERAKREYQQSLIGDKEQGQVHASRAATRTYSWLGNDGYEEPGLVEKTFATFNPKEQSKPALFAHALTVTREYAAQLARGEQPGNLLLTGPVGTGKTHLAAAICNAQRANGVGCLFTTAQTLFNALYASSFTEKQELIRQASMTPLLVFDDIDKLHISNRAANEDATSYQKTTLFEILNMRYRRELPTVITTNEQKDLRVWLDGAALSRLWEHMTLLEMNGIDYRAREEGAQSAQ